MILRLFSCSALALLFTLTGCRDALVDPDVGGPTPPPSVSETPAPYLKGPAEMPLGSSNSFRAEYVEGAAEYQWSITSEDEGQITGQFSEDGGGLVRFLSATASSFGRVNIAVAVYDIDGTLIATASKRVAITL